MRRNSDIPKYAFDIPLKATIYVRTHETNADYAVSQAEGELEALFDLLDNLNYVDKPIHKITQTKEEIVDEIKATWDKMTLEYQSIEEVRL